MITSRKQDEELWEIVKDEINLAHRSEELHGLDSVSAPDFTELINYIGDHFAPEELFEPRELASWARDHGYVEEEE